MKVFLSYSSADRKLAERIREELGTRGLTVWSSDQVATGAVWRDQIEQAIRAADSILVLVGPKSGMDEAQQFTCRTALEAVWENPGKRLIPILMHGAELPAFLSAWNLVRLGDSRDVGRLARTVVDVLQGKRVGGGDGGRETSKVTAEPTPIADANSGSARDARLSEITEYARRLMASSS
jgi:TIR domain